jgi:hypothetical protein
MAGQLGALACGKAEQVRITLNLAAERGPVHSSVDTKFHEQKWPQS